MEASRGRGEGGGAAVSKKPSAAGAKSAYGDVFGGPPRFAGAARMDDYAEIFGGMAASCSIPFLDLPPVGDGFGELPSGGKIPGFDYSEVFGGFDFGEFASTYEELLAKQRREGAVGSSNGRAPMESNLRQKASEACESPLKHRNGDPVLCPEDDQSSNSNHSDGGSKQFNLSYNKLDSGLKEYAINGITQITELHSSPRFSYTENKTLETEKSDLPHSVPHEAINDNKLQEKKIQTCSDDGSRGSRDGITTEWEQTDSHYPLPENDHVNVKHYSRPSSSHSASSGNMSPSEIMYVSVSDINLQTQPSRLPPPSRPPPKMFNKQVHPVVKMNTNSKIDLREGSSRKKISNHEKLSSEFISERPVVQEAVKESSPYSLDVEVDASSAAATAMKEAMELAQARLRSAKELMERKRDNFHSRKKMNHNVNIKPKDRVVGQASAGRENINPILMQKNMVNEPKQNGMDFREENKVHNTVISHDSKTIGDVSLAVEGEQMMSQNDLKSAKVCSGVEEESEKWKVNKEYYELTSNEKKCNKVTEISEQEASMIKIKETGKSVEQNEIKHIECSAVPEFENNTQLFSDSEENLKTENASSLRTDDISYAEERTRVTSNVVPDALLHENVINLEEICASHGEQNKMLEEVQGVDAEAVDVPCVRESDHGFLKIGEKVEESISQLNHDSVHVEGKSKVAKEFLGSGECSYEFKGIHDSEDEKSKSETSREEYIVDDASFIPHEVERTLDATQRTPALDEKEIKVLDDSVKPEGGEDSEAAYSFNDPEKAEREEQAKSNQVENENRKEETDMALEQKDNKTMQQESSMPEENDCRFEMDQEPDYLEEVYKKLKAAQEAAMNEEQEELTQETRPTWQEENNAYGAQNECQQSDKMQQSTQAPSTLGNSKEPNLFQYNNECTEDKDTREIHFKYDVFDKSPNLNTPHEVTEDKDTRELDLKSNIFDKSSNLNTPHEVFSSPPHIDLNMQKTNLLGRRSNIVGSTQDVLEKRNITSEKCMQMNNVEDSAQLQTEMEQADEQTRKLEEKEREREREKDRIAFERATREAHERALADARERAERIAVERVTAEARQRALKEACEKAELEKATKEARIRAERAAVERATAEARERAAERARTEMAAADSSSERFNNTSKDRSGSHITHFHRTGSAINSQGYSGGGESALRCKARLERHQRTAERAAKALAEKNRRDILAQREQAERDRLAEYLDAEVKRWSTGKEGNLRALLSTLQYILGTENGWQPIPLQEVVTAAAVKKAYRKATLFVHPDKLQQRGATIQQKYICEKVFDLLKEAWNRFNSEER